MDLNSGKYIYPHKPFYNLSDSGKPADFIKNPKTISWQELQSVVANIPQPELQISGETIAEKIFSVFYSKEIYAGELSMLAEMKQHWLDLFNGFIKKNEPIVFSMTNCPFKIPCPLKTERLLPDLAELLFLRRVNLIMESIRSVYKPGAKLILMVEGLFGSFIGVGNAEADAYKKSLTELCEIFGYSHNLIIHDLAEIKVRVPEFQKLWDAKYEMMKVKLAEDAEDFREEFWSAYNSMYRIINTRKYSRDVLVQTYNMNLKDSDLAPEILAQRKEMEAHGREATLRYRAFLRTRDDVKYNELVAPGVVKLTVLAKRESLGVFPIASNLDLLPFHGIPSIDSQGNVTLDYLVNMQRSGKNYQPVHIAGDLDPKPFYYQF